MAPEQADPNRHAEIARRPTRYALGVLAYRMLAGRVPFPGNTRHAHTPHLNLDVPTPGALCAGFAQASLTRC
jgi:serine/threonine protein kinase